MIGDVKKFDLAVIGNAQQDRLVRLIRQLDADWPASLSIVI